MDDEALTRRAFAAYFRSDGEYAPIPSGATSGLTVHNDKPYIALRNSSDTLAVYRVGSDGILRRLRRWPKAVESW